MYNDLKKDFQQCTTQTMSSTKPRTCYGNFVARRGLSRTRRLPPRIYSRDYGDLWTNLNEVLDGPNAKYPAPWESGEYGQGAGVLDIMVRILRGVNHAPTPTK